MRCLIREWSGQASQAFRHLFITIAAVLSGCNDWNEIELYGQTKEEWLRKYLELPGGIPSHDTFNRVFSLLNPDALRECFLSWVEQIAQRTEGEVVSIDGKRLCGSGEWQTLHHSHGQCLEWG